MMLTILWNQLSPIRSKGNFRDQIEGPMDLLRDMIQREDEELALLVPCFLKVMHDADAR